MALLVYAGTNKGPWYMTGGPPYPQRGLGDPRGGCLRHWRLPKHVVGWEGHLKHGTTQYRPMKRTTQHRSIAKVIRKASGCTPAPWASVCKYRTAEAHHTAYRIWLPASSLLTCAASHTSSFGSGALTAS